MRNGSQALQVKWLQAAWLASSLIVGVAQAQGRTEGEWTAWSGDPKAVSPTLRKDCSMDDATLAAWFARAKRLHEQLRTTPLTVPPEFRLRWSADWMVDGVASCRSGPLKGQLLFSPYPGTLLKRDARTGKIEPIDTTSSLMLHLNEIRGLMPLEWQKSEDDPEIGIARATARLRGFPVIEDRYAIITPPNAPEPFVPAPADLVLRRWIANTEKDLADIEPIARASGNSPEIAANFARLRKGLENARGLLRQVQSGPRDRTVWFRKDGLFDELSLERRGDAAAVMWVNPRYFASVKGRSGIYVISVDVSQLDLGTPDSGTVEGATDVNRQLATRADWQAVARSLP